LAVNVQETQEQLPILQRLDYQDMAQIVCSELVEGEVLQETLGKEEPDSAQVVEVVTEIL